METIGELLLWAERRLDEEVLNEYHINDINYWRGYIDALNTVKKIKKENENV